LEHSEQYNEPPKVIDNPKKVVTPTNSRIVGVIVSVLASGVGDCRSSPRRVIQKI
jgi:hypothetical protein